MVERGSCGSGPICLVTPEVAQHPPESILHICLQSMYNFVILIVQYRILLC